MKLIASCMLTVACAFATAAAAATLPPRLDVPAPFPRIVTQAPTFERIAPGVTYADYEIQSSGGPLSIHVIAIAPDHAGVRIGAVLAHDSLTSSGERVSEMTDRTGAIAGINGDYFDTGKTNRPTNLVVVDGRLLLNPRKRYALIVTKDGHPHFVESSFFGQVQIADRTLQLEALNDLPPPGGATSLVTPDYGEIPPLENVTLIALQPLEQTPFGRFRVTAIADNLHAQPPGYYLALGLSAYGSGDIPSPGDVVTTSGDLSPTSLDSIATTVGGGPLILRDGAWFEDPDGPNTPDILGRNPSSAAAITPDGTLFLIEVDGRNPFVSVGITREELCALMRALGATQGMLFDGGGSSAMTVRHEGESAAVLQTLPSDGVERPVSVGVFLYDQSARGEPTQLVGSPQTVHALVASQAPVHIGAIDANAHPYALTAPLRASVLPATLGTYRDGVFNAQQAGEGWLELRSGSLRGRVALHVVQSPARIAILPEQPHTMENGTVRLSVRAYDAAGYALAVPANLRWSATNGAIDAQGLFHAATSDGLATVAIGDRTATQRVLVGMRQTQTSFAENAHFATIPRGGAGSLVRDPQCPTCLQLSFALGPDERAAYALTDAPLPSTAIGVTFDVRDDGSGAQLRVAVRNGLNQQVLINAGMLVQPGWRHVTAFFPATVTAPARLTAIYVIASDPSQLRAGSIVLRDVQAIVAGAQ